VTKTKERQEHIQEGGDSRVGGEHSGRVDVGMGRDMTEGGTEVTGWHFVILGFECDNLELVP
jgi:hypothetical protein